MKPVRRFSSGMKRALSFLIGLFILPVAISASIVLYTQIGSIQYISKNQLFFLLGVGSYLIVHLLFYQPTTIYIFGHELTHALCTWLCGGKVRSFRASWRGGRVITTKSNLFITLAPYFLPIYTVIISFGYFMVSLFSDLSKYIPQFIFLIGLSWSFHIVLTAHFIRMKQPDILKAGTLFSISLIYILNVTILALLLSSLFPEVAFRDFFSSSYWQTVKIYASIFSKLSL